MPCHPTTALKNLRILLLASPSTTADGPDWKTDNVALMAERDHKANMKLIAKELQ
jgi:hypothetical protein